MNSPYPPRRPSARPTALALAACAALACFACAAKERPGTPPRHALLITVGGLRPDHMSTYLYLRPTTGWPRTPRPRVDGHGVSIDDLAVAGVLFESAFAPSPWSGPSAATALTGAAPFEHGLATRTGTLSSEATTLAEVFAGAGFRTSARVSAPALAGVAGLEQGFDDWQSFADDAAALEAAAQWAQGDFAGPQFLWIDLAGPTWPYRPGTIPERPGTSEVAAAEPWDLARAFVDSAWSGPADVEALLAGRAPADLAREELAFVGDQYDGALCELAYRVRAFLLAFSATPAFEDTLIAFAGLHGVELGEHGRFGHEELLETTLRVPFFVRHPRSLTGARILAEPVELADVAPTLIDWFGLPRPAGCTGRSVLALTDSYVERSFASRPAVAVLAGEGRAAASAGDGDWRATWSAPAGGVPALALHDVDRDPCQTADRALADPEQLRSLAQALAERLGGAGPRWAAIAASAEASAAGASSAASAPRAAGIE